MRANRDFLDKVFCEDAEFQSALLKKTLQYARQRRRHRNGLRAGGITAVFCSACLLAFLLYNGPERSSFQRTAPMVNTAKLNVVPGTSIRLVNDEELLEMFAGRPVAFIGSGNQRQFVVLDVLRHSINDRTWHRSD